MMTTKSQEKFVHPVMCKKSSVETSSEKVDTKRSSVRFPHFTKEPQDMVQCFLKVIASEPQDYLRRFGRKAEAKALAKTHFLPKQTTGSKTCDDSPRESKLKNVAQNTKKNFKNKTTDYSFIRKPILVERHSSDEEREPDSKNGVKLTLQRAKYRRQIEREKKRLNDIQKEFESMANEESRLKKINKLSKLPKPNIRQTRTYNLRIRALLQNETGIKNKSEPDLKSSCSESKSSVKSTENKADISTAGLMKSKSSKRRNCIFRIHNNRDEQRSRSKSLCRTAEKTTPLTTHKPNCTPLNSLDKCSKRGNPFVRKRRANKTRYRKRTRVCTGVAQEATERLSAEVRRRTGPSKAEKEAVFWHQRLVNWRVNTGENLPPFK